MFITKETYLSIPYLLDFLDVYHQWHRQTGCSLSGLLDDSTVYESALALMNPFGDYFIDYDEDYDEECWSVNAEHIQEYYRLCHLFGRKHHIRWDKNPYVIRARRHFYQVAGPYDNEFIDWYLQETRQKRKDIGFYVSLTTSYLTYSDYLDIPLLVVQLLLWYQQNARELRIAWERGQSV